MSCVRCNNRTPQHELPMEYFTSEEAKPSEKTLNFIRQIAYTYRVLTMNGRTESYCLN